MCECLFGKVQREAHHLQINVGQMGIIASLFILYSSKLLVPLLKASVHQACFERVPTITNLDNDNKI